MGSKLTADDHERMRRNLNPHAEARMAMVLWSHEYAFEQKGGSMDFWDSLSVQRKAYCTSVLDAVLEALETNGRAALTGSDKT